MDEPSAGGKATLDRDSWIQAAIGVLAEEGIDGVRVEVLAKRCKVTKGSFYWHFRDRQDLLSAVLADWREGRIRDITKQTAAMPGQELDQIHHVIDVYSANRNRRGILIELAVRDWARRDAEAAVVVEEVDRVRLELGQRLFLQRGVPDREAAARSLLLYAYVFGQSLMNYDHFATDIPALKNWIAGHIAGDEA
ncbi:MAG: TetR/AcrR family transcriptional regulator [Betaproteobacteria bacterium]|nr:TetR/AcrR family transcriptional regulator [Betaproteobacteria bacterium]